MFFRLLFRFVPLSDIHSIQNMHLENPCHNSPPRSIGRRLCFFGSFFECHLLTFGKNIIDSIGSDIFRCWVRVRYFSFEISIKISLLLFRQGKIRFGVEWKTNGTCAHGANPPCVSVCAQKCGMQSCARSLWRRHIRRCYWQRWQSFVSYRCNRQNSVAMNFNKSKISIWIRRRVAQILRSRAEISN